jgi:hypothetical protein
MKMAEFRTVRLIGTLLGATLVLSGCQKKKGDAISSAEQLSGSEQDIEIAVNDNLGL